MLDGRSMARRSRTSNRSGEPDAAHRARASEAIVADGRLTYPDSLPITAWHDELLAAIREHQVVVVAGETGSGKSTQLPKLCIEAGRGTAGLIGHTQPRRVAARTIAERVAEELGSPLGADVGYAVRFTDTVGPATVVKVMTDGILLAEIQRDRELRRYDTLIIDEAHERSLNIDFILGYLKGLLSRRPELSVIVTSATIDTERFAAHFAAPPTDDPAGDPVPAPVIEVSGRTYPVELRYRPYGAANLDVPDGQRDQRDQVQAVIDAVDELRAEGPGDVLVFLSGEREIHDTADALRRLDEPGASAGRRTAANRDGGFSGINTERSDESDEPRTEVLPLYARLSAPEQHRIFQPHRGRRIVLATNVAETSLTVPGIRYVVDAGRARISRYSRRLKVQRLPIEPVSQASADQRAGRCGRVAPGVCIRLYAEEDFATRPEFTEPEILRTNLASVILQMTSIGLGDVGAFPFVEPPDSAAIRDGYLLLEELDAIGPAGSDDRSPGWRRLTKIGRRLARLPIDPRLGRMVLEAERHGCVREVLVIASALSIQDVRERPEDKREQANELHNRFRVAGSDLLSIVALWDYLREQQRARSGNQFRRLCRNEFLHYLRVREWMDLYSQLRRVAGDLGIRPTTTESHPDLVHRAVLAGLLSHIGVRQGDRRDYRGARQAEFVIAPGSALTRRPPEWVMAAELVETSRLFARRVAGIDPAWAESAGAHLVKRSYGEPRWDADGGRAVVTESVTLYGLPLVTDRVLGLDRVDPDAARAWFVSKALVEGDVAGRWVERQAFLARNDAFLDRIGSLAARARRAEMVDDEVLFAFYDDRVGDDVVSTRHFDRWWKRARRDDEHRLDLTDAIVGEHGVDPSAYPDVWRQGEVELPLTYRFAPGEPLDGVTAHLPLSGLNQVADEGFDWQIPGYRDDLVAALLRTLPKAIRRELIPLAETTATVLDRLGPPRGRLVDALAATVAEVAGVVVSPGDFDGSALPDDLRMHFVVSADDGEVHDVGTDLTEIKRRLAGTARASIAAAAPIEERRGITRWDFGDLPRVVESSDRGFDVRGYPTLLDVGPSVSLRVVSDPDLQRRALHGGVRRLLLLDAAPTAASTERTLTGAQRLALAGGDIPPADVVGDCVAAAVDRVMLDHGALPWTAAEFEELERVVRRDTPALAAGALSRAVRVVVAANDVRAHLARLIAPAMQESVTDANAHLGRLVRPGFVLAAGVDGLDDVERYVSGIAHRLGHLAGAVERDRRRMAEVVPLEERYARFVDALPAGGATPELADLARRLEELRVSVFAQPLGARGPVSPQRISKALTALGA